MLWLKVEVNVVKGELEIVWSLMEDCETAYVSLKV